MNLKKARAAAENHIKRHAEGSGTQITAMGEPVVKKGEVHIEASTADGRTLKAVAGEYDGRTGSRLDPGR